MAKQGLAQDLLSPRPLGSTWRFSGLGVSSVVIRLARPMTPSRSHPTTTPFCRTTCGSLGLFPAPASRELQEHRHLQSTYGNRDLERRDHLLRRTFHSFHKLGDLRKSGYLSWSSCRASTKIPEFREIPASGSLPVLQGGHECLTDCGVSQWG